jgi:hypothetical protein
MINKKTRDNRVILKTDKKFHKKQVKKKKTEPSLQLNKY